MLIGVAMVATGAAAGGKGPKSLYAALTSANNGQDAEGLTASIGEQRARIESLENQFQARGAELAKQFQELDTRRRNLKAGDIADVQRFNAEAQAYTAQNNAHKAMAAGIESARNELTDLLDARARLRASNPSVASQDAEPDSQPPGAAAAVGPTGKRVVMYTTATCPACVAAKTYLARRGLRYEERDVERSSEALKEFRSLGGRGVPLILVDKERMVGFDPRQFERMIRGL
jgi:glutaredoxin 3